MKLSRIICAFTGHVPRTKMSCVICDRCRIILVNHLRMPQGVRVVGKDGTKHLAALRFVGEVDGMQVWCILSPIPLTEVASVEMDHIPEGCRPILDEELP